MAGVITAPFKQKNPLIFMKGFWVARGAESVRFSLNN